MKKILFGLVLGVSSLGITSCELNSPKYEPLPVEVQYYATINYTHVLFFDLVKQALEMTTLQVNNPNGSNFPTGVTVTPVVENGTLISLAVEYAGLNERVGKLNILYTGVPFTEGSKMVITPDNLSYNTASGIVKFSGTTTLIYSAKEASKAKFSIHLVGGLLSDQSKNELAFGSNLICEQKEGATSDLKDDTFTFTGTESGAFVNKQAYNVSITKPLIYNYKSNYAGEGKVSITPFGYQEPFTIEFGKGTFLNEVYLSYKDLVGFYKI